jgi:hypothetical protein
LLKNNQQRKGLMCHALFYFFSCYIFLQDLWFFDYEKSFPHIGC